MRVISQRLLEHSAGEFVTAALLQPDSYRKRLFEERLFPLVETAAPELAPKITSMLLEMDDYEIAELLECPAALEAKIREALEVLAEGEVA